MFDVPVMVVGDVMLDRHVHGHVRRISPEAPVPVVSLAGEVHTPGGAGNVAATLAGLGCPVTLAGLVGADAEGAQLREALHAKGVDRLALHEGPGLQTISKTRILSDGQQQLLRLDRDGDRAAFAAAAEGLLERILPLIDEQAAVVLADYEKGAITPAVARAVIDRCRRAGHPLRGRPQEGRLRRLCPRDRRDPEPAGGRAGRRPAAAGRRGGRPRRRRDADRARSWTPC